MHIRNLFHHSGTREDRFPSKVYWMLLEAWRIHRYIVMSAPIHSGELDISLSLNEKSIDEICE